MRTDSFKAFWFGGFLGLCVGVAVSALVAFYLQSAGKPLQAQPVLAATQAAPAPPPAGASPPSETEPPPELDPALDRQAMNIIAASGGADLHGVATLDIQDRAPDLAETPPPPARSPTRPIALQAKPANRSSSASEQSASPPTR